jgi:hypothetical protein
MRWTPEQADSYLSRVRACAECEQEQADDGPESRLQAKIEGWCQEWGRPYLSLRQSKRAKGFIRQTWVDVTIAMPAGRTLYLELKSKSGRMSREQEQLRLQLMALGHEVYEVRSYKRFLEITEG